MSLGACVLAYTHVTSFTGPTMLETGFCGVVWVAIDSFSTFSTFWVKLAIVGHVSRTVTALDNANKYEEVADGVNEKQQYLLKFCL